MASNDDPMIAECMRPAINCARGMATCSQVKGLDESGDKCRRWFENRGEGDRSALAESYCLKYDTEDCRCINRIYNDDYRTLKAGNPIADKCWYLPCSNPDHYFITSEDAAGVCPDKVCEIVYDIYKNRDVNVLQNNIVCDLSGTGFVDNLLQMIERNGYVIIIALSLVALYYVNTRNFEKRR